jgi:hypothetical protein
VLVLAPTREIAMQGVEAATQIGAHLPDLKLASFIGGLPVAEDKRKAVHCQLAVGTPGRLRQVGEPANSVGIPLMCLTLGYESSLKLLTAVFKNNRL